MHSKRLDAINAFALLALVTQLREANSRIVAIVESSGDEFIAFDGRWGYEYVNGRALDAINSTLGTSLSRDDLSGRTVWDLFPAFEHTDLHRMLERSRRSERPARVQGYSVPGDRWVEAWTFPWNGGFAAYTRDVSADRAAAERLRYHASLLDNVEDAVIATDADGFRIIAWNRGAERLYGYSAEEVLGRPVREVGRFQDDAARVNFEQELLQNGRARAEIAARHRNGAPVEVELVGVAVRGEQGEISGYLGIHRDITERKRAVQQLAYQARVLENVGDAVLATDADLVLTAWNRSAERMFGWTSDEAVGRRVYELIPTSLTDAEMAAELGALRERGWWRGEATWYGKHHKAVIAEALTVALRCDGGETQGYVCIMRDFTQLRRATGKLETAAREQAVLADLSLRALSSKDLQPLLDDAVTVVADVLQVELSSIAELGPAGDTLAWRVAFGWSDRELAHAPPSPAGTGSLAGYAIMSGQPVVSEDASADERFRITPLLARQAPASAAAVVIPGPSQPFGVLAVVAGERRAFGPDEVGFLQAVANVIAGAVERRALGDRLDTARESERRRVARELHDDGLRELTEALGVAAIGGADSVEGPDRQHWTAVSTSLQRLGQQLRSAIYDLRLGTHEDRAFADLLDDLVTIQDALSGDCTVELHGRRALPSGSLGHRGTEVLRIVREAIINARHHSETRIVRVDAAGSTDRELRIEVTDDGPWPDRAADAGSGQSTGIVGMLERAEELGAELTIGERPDGGTGVWLALSLERRGGRSGGVANERPPG
jgi:PAS domain S-box-containing protein